MIKIYQFVSLKIGLLSKVKAKQELMLKKSLNCLSKRKLKLLLIRAASLNCLSAQGNG